MQIELANFYGSLGVIALILALGFLIGKLGWISAHTNKQLVNLLLMVFMPAAIFNAFPREYSTTTAQTFFLGLAAGFIVMLAMIILSRLLFMKKLYRRNLRYEAQFAFIFNNATFLGYPLISTAFGAEGIIPYCGFIVAFNLALFSYGIWLFERKFSWRFLRRIATNPNIIAVLLGMLCFLLQLHLPAALDSAISYTAAATTPLSLICIGCMLAAANFKHLAQRWRLLIIAVLQLTFAPLVTWCLLSVLNFPMQVIIICTLLQALPTATSLGLFAEKYGGNVEESSELVVISTVMSVITLPIITTILFA